MQGNMTGVAPRDEPKASVEDVRQDTHVEKGTATKGINYAHVRTNWTTYPLGGSFECVMVSKSQVLSGSLTVPKQRAERILGVSDANIPRFHRTDPSRLVRVEEPFKKRTEVHDVNMDACAVVWNASCTRGYLVKLKHYKSQPTQVFLHGLHACFEELQVEAWSVLCFVPIGVVGHCQLFVWPAGHPHYQGFQSCTVHQWSFMKTSSENTDMGDEDTKHHPLPEPGVLAIETAQCGDGRTEAVVVKNRFVSLSTEDISIVSPALYPKKWVDTSGKMGRSKKGLDGSLQKGHPSLGRGEEKDGSFSAMQKQRRARKEIQRDSENTDGRNRGLQDNQATGSKNSVPFQDSHSNAQSLTGKNPPSDAHRTNLPRRRMRKTRPVQSHTV